MPKSGIRNGPNNVNCVGPRRTDHRDNPALITHSMCDVSGRENNQPAPPLRPPRWQRNKETTRSAQRRQHTGQTRDQKPTIENTKKATKISPPSTYHPAKIHRRGKPQETTKQGLTRPATHQASKIARLKMLSKSSI